MKIIDNFLPKNIHQELYDLLIGKNANFPWYFNNDVVFESTNDYIENFQFTHTFYLNFTFVSEYYKILFPIIDLLSPSSLVKIKANLNTHSSKIIERELHTDVVNFKGKTAVYYLNTNNGYTKFANGDTVESVANRILIFDNTLLHAGTTSTDTKVRCVLNFNYT